MSERWNLCAQWDLRRRDRASTSPNDKESNMSGINGDKSRFHRERKQKIARRKRNRELLKNLAEGQKLTPPASVSKPKTVSQ